MSLIQRVVFFVILVSSFVITATAQDSEPPKKNGIQLQFIPPPMEGTVSMGIYDPAGKLVRVLHQEAHEDEFFPALNGLITYWDGKDDSGKVMPAGKYRARGYMVGAMDFDGVAFVGNDWVSDGDSPRIKNVLNISSSEGNLLMFVQSADNTFLRLTCDPAGKIIKKERIEQFAAKNLGDWPSGGSSGYSRNSSFLPVSAVTIRDGKIFYTEELKIPSLVHPVDAWLARDEGIWVIDRAADGVSDIKEFSLKGEFKRHLAVLPDDPTPVKITASQTSDTIFLLETKTNLQRVRALSLQPKNDAPADATSVWKIDFSKVIHAGDTLDQIRDQLKMPDDKPFVPQDKIRLTLLPNPLEQDKPGAVDISIGVDAKGSFLKAGDGLPLCRVSETANLKWASMAREPGSKAVIIFQSDGAVVEEFKVGKLANMVAFDCGDFMFDPAKVK